MEELVRLRLADELSATLSASGMEFLQQGTSTHASGVNIQDATTNIENLPSYLKPTWKSTDDDSNLDNKEYPKHE